MKSKASDQIGKPAFGMPTLNTVYTFVNKIHTIDLKKSVSLIDSFQIKAKRVEFADDNEKLLLINADINANPPEKGFIVNPFPEEGIKNKELGDAMVDVEDACKLIIQEKEKDLKELKKLSNKIEKLIEFYEADIKDKTNNGLQYDKNGKLINVVVAPEE